LWKFFVFGRLGETHVESEEFEEHTRQFTGYFNQHGSVCADLFAFCEFPER